jgi:hypothetical protein
MTRVFVAVNLDLGWDNVIGVFDSMEKAVAACSPSPEDLAGPDGDWYRERCEDDGMFAMHHIHDMEIR